MSHLVLFQWKIPSKGELLKCLSNQPSKILELAELWESTDFDHSLALGFTVLIMPWVVHGADVDL